MSHSFRRFAVSAAVAAFTFASAFAQDATSTASPAPPPGHTVPNAQTLRGHSWSDLWRAKEAKLEAAGQGEPLAIKRLTAPKKGVHHEGGSIGTESYSVYYSGSDTSLGFPTSFDQYAGAARQSNCSLSEVIVGYNTDDNKYEEQQIIPNFEKYLHTVSGLSTTVDKFPNGCTDPVMSGATNKVVALGKDSAGNYVGAQYSFIFDDAIYVGVYNSSYVNIANHDYAVGYNINGIAAADFNGDGYGDMAVIDTATTAYTTSQISVLIANGDGTYKAPVQINTGVNVYGIVTGDFNGDKKQDMVVSAQTTGGTFEILFYAGNGDGTFKAPVVTNTGTTERLVTQPADLNNDGKLDIVAWDIGTTTEPQTYTLESLINNGSAVFTATPSVTANGYYPVATGDLNNDGKLDIVYTNTQESTFVVLEGDGAGHFTNKGTWPTVFFPTSAYISDFDGDGNPDILIGIGSEGGLGPVEEGQGEILLGNGNFSFSSPATPQPLTSTVSFLSGPRAFSVADLNGDAKADVAVVGVNGASDNGPAPLAVTTFLNNGTTTLGAGTTVNFTVTTTQFNGAPMLVAPLSGTTPNDIVVAGTDPSSQGAAIQAAVNTGSDSFTTKALLDVSAEVVSMVSADFNADGKGDLAFITNDGAADGADGLYTARGNGNGTFQAPVLLDSAIDAGGQVFTADVNGDGKPDIIAIQATAGYSYVRVYLNQGTTFAAPVSFSTPDGAVITWIIAADLNGDGKLDLGVIGSTTDGIYSNLYLYTGNKTATFTYASTTSLGGGEATTGIAADVNKDGIVDVVVDGYTGPGILLGKGAGAFYPAQPFVVPQGASGVQAINLTSSTYPDLVFSIYGYNDSLIATSVNHYANAPSVSKAATSVTIENPGDATQSYPIYLYATVAENSAAGQPTGTVTLSSGSNVLQTATVSGGEVYFDLPTTGFQPGNYTLTMSYSGDNFNQPSSSTVTFKLLYLTATTLTVTPAAIDYDGTVTLTSKVTRTLSSGTPTGYVEFFYDGGNASLTQVPLVNGVASLTTSVKGYPPGQYALQAAYYGESGSNAVDSDSGSPIVNTSIAPKGLTATTTTLALSPNPITYGQTATLTATVAPGSGSTVPTGTVTFYALFYGKTYNLGTVALNNKGVATARAGTSSFGYYGYFTLYAIYNGNSTTYGSDSTQLSVYLRDPADVFFSQDSYTVTSGQSVTLIAGVVANTTNPITGTVTFSADGINLATVAVVNSSATFTASTAGLAKGTYTVTASYNGDQYNGIASTKATVTIQ